MMEGGKKRIDTFSSWRDYFCFDHTEYPCFNAFKLDEDSGNIAA